MLRARPTTTLEARPGHFVVGCRKEICVPTHSNGNSVQGFEMKPSRPLLAKIAINLSESGLGGRCGGRRNMRYGNQKNNVLV